MDTDEKYSIKQIADTLGISKDTVLRAIQKGELKAELGHGPAGAQYWLDVSYCRDWWQRRKSRISGHNAAPQEAQLPQGVTEATQASIASGSEEPQEAQLNEKRKLEVFSLPSAAPQTVPAEVHLQALRLVERAQLQMEALQFELGSTRKALSAQAESLIEQQELDRKARELAAEAARQRELWEAEKLQLLQELSTHKHRVDWLEKRVPRWVRRVFGATSA